MPAAPTTHFSNAEVARRFRAARRQALGGNQYIIQFQRKGQGLPLEWQRQHFCIPTWDPRHIVTWQNDPVRAEWDGGYLHAIEECGPLAHGFVLDLCRYQRCARAVVARGESQIEELYDNALLWLGTPTDNPRARICGAGGWLEVPYLRPVRQGASTPLSQQRTAA